MPPAVFKTVGLYVKRAVGGFDSHALPLRGVQRFAGLVFHRDYEPLLFGCLTLTSR